MAKKSLRNSGFRMNINNIYKILIDMKNLMMGVMMFLTCTTTSMAQGFKEPEYIGQVSLVQSANSQQPSDPGEGRGRNEDQDLWFWLHSYSRQQFTRQRKDVP